MSVMRKVLRLLALTVGLSIPLIVGAHLHGASANGAAAADPHRHAGGHGPDPAPPGIDVRRVPSTDELVARETSTGGTSGTGGGQVPCYGDGVSGSRVQAIYAVASDRTDRYGSVAPLIRGWAAQVDAIFNESAAQTGGVRHVRWVTDASCALDVQRVVVASNADDSFSAMVSALKSAGHGRTDRKYLIWADASVYCGVADMKTDDRATASNANNAGAMYARVDAACWGQANSTEAHELMHTLGGVQASAPHATSAGHCTDESDRMCYADGSNSTLTYPCAATQERLFDCNHDDYFSTSPAAGSYLASHWNAAMNIYLEQAEPGAVAPAPAPAPAPEGTTETYSGSLTRKASIHRYTFDAAAGTFSAAASYGAKSTLTLTLRDAAGAIVRQVQGKGSATISHDVPAGRYVLELSSSNATYNLNDSYAA